MLAILDMGDTMYELRGFKTVTDTYPATLELFVTGETSPKVLEGDTKSVTYMAQAIRERILFKARVINMEEVMHEVESKLMQFNFGDC